MGFVDRYNAAVGAAVAIFTALFGAYWYLFAGYLALNVIDWLTGWYKARKLGRESSAVGWHGAAKKSRLLDHYSSGIFNAHTFCPSWAGYAGD